MLFVLRFTFNIIISSMHRRMAYSSLSSCSTVCDNLDIKCHVASFFWKVFDIDSRREKVVSPDPGALDVFDAKSTHDTRRCGEASIIPITSNLSEEEEEKKSSIHGVRRGGSISFSVEHSLVWWVGSRRGCTHTRITFGEDFRACISRFLHCLLELCRRVRSS